jgi:hypothetical protein
MFFRPGSNWQTAQKDLREEARDDRSFGFVQDKLGEGVLFSTLERGDRVQRSP